MSNTVILVLSWFAVALHIAVATATLRRWSTLPLLPALNLLVALCVLAWWIPKWHSYVFSGITWYASDQWIPVFALAVIALAVSTLAGRSSGQVPHWIIFGIHGLALLVAALFFTFFRMDRSI